MTMLFLADAGDTLLKGMTYTHSLGVLYRVRMVAYLVLSVVAIFVDNPAFHATFAVLATAFEIGLIFTSYLTIN